MKHAHQSKAISSATGRTLQLISANRSNGKERFTVQVLNRKNMTHRVQNMAEIIHKMFLFGIHS